MGPSRSTVAYVALLRGVNLAGHRQVAMNDLRELAVALRLEEPRTLLQSGNLVFRSRKQSPAALEQLLEAETEKRLGLRTDVMIRTADEWQAIVAKNPFPKEAKSDPSHLLVTFFKEPANEAAIRAVMATYKGPEIVRAAGREIFTVYPDGIGRSKLGQVMTDARTGGRGTGRNWNTVLKLLDAVRA